MYHFYSLYVKCSQQQILFYYADSVKFEVKSTGNITK